METLFEQTQAAICDLPKEQLINPWEREQYDSGKILLVDHQPKNLIPLEQVLKNEQFHIFKAVSSNEALALSLKYKFAVIIMNAHMPIMDGVETTRILRSHEETQHIPVLLLTAAPLEIARDKGPHCLKELGYVDILIKPVHISILKAKVQFLVHQFLQFHSTRLFSKNLMAYRELVLYLSHLLEEQIDEHNHTIQKLFQLYSEKKIQELKTFIQSLASEDQQVTSLISCLSKVVSFESQFHSKEQRR